MPTKFELYQKAINSIDDFFEYRYKSCSQLRIKAEVIEILEKLTHDIRSLQQIDRTKAIKYMIGQRVLIGDYTIGTIVKPEVNHSSFDIWVYNPKKGFASGYALTSIKPLPNGQL